jgi:hypothetical protein
MRPRLLPSVLATVPMLVAWARSGLSQATTSYALLNGTVIDASGRHVVEATILLHAMCTNEVLNHHRTRLDITYYQTSPPFGRPVVPDVSHKAAASFSSSSG